MNYIIGKISRHGKLAACASLSALLLLLLAGCAVVGGGDGGASDSAQNTELPVSQARFDHFEKDFAAVRDFVMSNKDVLYHGEPTAIYREYDEEGCYLYTNDSMDIARMDDALRKRFENIYVLMNAHGGYGYISYHSGGVSFEFSGGTRSIAYIEGDKKPQGEIHRYADGWYCLSGTSGE
jgi:hypothetical protein